MSIIEIYERSVKDYIACEEASGMVAAIAFEFPKSDSQLLFPEHEHGFDLFFSIFFKAIQENMPGVEADKVFKKLISFTGTKTVEKLKTLTFSIVYKTLTSGRECGEEYVRF